MQSRRSIVVGLLLGSVIGPAIGREGPKDPSRLTTGMRARRFDQRLFAALLESSARKNIGYSPFSVSTTLDLLTLGADGDTLRQLVQSRGTDIDSMTHRQSVPQFIASLSDGDAILRVSSSVWLRSGARPRPAFSIAAKALFAADVKNVDFAKSSTIDAINGWAKENTGGLISRVVDALEPESEFVIGNTAYFKGKWAFSIDPGKTSAGPFSTIRGGTKQVQLMRASIKVPYLEKDDWHAIALPYKGRKLEMVVVTAKDPKGSSSVLQKMLSAGFPSVIEPAAFSDREAFVVFPRFKVEYGADLTKHMSQLGLTKVFGGQANFGHMTSSKVNDLSILHRAVVDVNEEGTEAAASTAVIATREAGAVPPVQFLADRPFMFLIRDRASGAVFFQGYIHDPSS